ncbi:hypothetical protein ACFOY2_49375 [Nonomuraea purpurea]|uniref:Uncharacterized protein n=1 Tax=Nonomuraea purpurea TaxID=1849276 RepID=A0ABV8GR87_9ACTN
MAGGGTVRDDREVHGTDGVTEMDVDPVGPGGERGHLLPSW